MSDQSIQFRRISGQPRRVEQQTTHLAMIVDVPGSQQARALRVDRDNIEGLFAGLRAQVMLELRMSGQVHTQTLSFTDPEDLEPDGIAAALGAVQRLRALRKDLENDSNAEAAIAELSAFLAQPDNPPAASSSNDEATPAPAKPESADDSFQALLGGARQAPGTSSTGSFVARLLADTDTGAVTDRSHLVAQCDALINDLVNQVLSNEEFRRLERKLRGAYWLASELELDDDELQLWLLPADLNPARHPAALIELQAGLARITAAAERGSLAAIAVDCEFETPEDLEFLRELTQLAQALSTTILIKAPASLTAENSTLELEAGYPGNNPETSAAWQAFRSEAIAGHCAAVLPRFLLRLPYGSRGEATYLPSFEELAAAPDHEQFLWINPVYALLYLLGSATEGLSVEGLPMPIYQDGSGDAIMPSAEAHLTEADVADLQNKGIMALQSYRNKNAVTLNRFFPVI